MGEREREEGTPPSIRRTLFGSGDWVSPGAARAHAMKNCLTVINGVAELLEPELSEANRSRLARLERASARLAALIEDQIALDEPSAIGEESRPIDVSALVEHVHTLLCDRAEARGVGLSIKCATALIEGDASELEEALFNVVANALEATPRGGRIEIETSVDDQGDHLWMVRDAGGGIPRDVLVHAGDHRRSSRQGGTGLGIAIAAAAVRAHGGLLNIEAFEAHGTVVTMWLPGSHRESFVR